MPGSRTRRLTTCRRVSETTTSQDSPVVIGVHSAKFDGSTGSAQAPVNLGATHTLTVEFWMNWNAFENDDKLAMEFTNNFNENAGGFLIDPDGNDIEAVCLV